MPSLTFSLSASTPSLAAARRHELLPGSGRGLADLRAGAFNSAAAAGGRLVDGESGVALDDFDLFPRHVQLFCGDLCQRGLDAGAEVDLTGNNGHRAVLSDGKPGIQLCRVEHRRFGTQIRLREKPMEGGKRLKLTMSAPVPLRNCLRLSSMVFIAILP